MTGIMPSNKPNMMLNCKEIGVFLRGEPSGYRHMGRPNKPNAKGTGDNNVQNIICVKIGFHILRNKTDDPP